MSKILIVDDNVNTCFLVKSFLEEMGHDVIVSHYGIDALEKVKNLKPNIMLLDMIIEGGMGGMEILRRVRKSDNKIGIIMISALIDEVYRKKTLENGANEYITKPFDYDHLNECILDNITMRSRE